MRKTLVACVVGMFLLVPGLVEAQLSLGFRGGLTRTDISLDEEEDTELNSISGIVLGGFVQFPAGDNFGIQAGLNYTQKGAELTDEDGTFEIGLDYIEVPVLAVVSFPSSGPFGVRLMGGPVLSFEASCEVSGEVEGSGLTADCEDSGVNTKSTDFGIQVGGGVIYDIQDAASLFLDVGYNFGLTNVDDDDGPDNDDSAKNRALLVSVGVDFPVGG